MLTQGLPVLGINKMSRAITFWTSALDYVVINGGPDAAWTTLGPAGQPAALALQASRTPVQDYPRMHLDLNADSAAEQEREADRLVGLGAERVDWDSFPDDPDFIVLADTEGNRFCVVDKGHVPSH
jgi:Glyoxalase-like domain